MSKHKDRHAQNKTVHQGPPPQPQQIGVQDMQMMIPFKDRVIMRLNEVRAQMWQLHQEELGLVNSLNGITQTENEAAAMQQAIVDQTPVNYGEPEQAVESIPGALSGKPSPAPEQ